MNRTQTLRVPLRHKKGLCEEDISLKGIFVFILASFQKLIKIRVGRDFVRRGFVGKNHAYVKIKINCKDGND